MSAEWLRGVFYANLLAQGLLLKGAAWCIAFPKQRIYKMAHDFLTSLIFVHAPLVEESWLEEQYGQPYDEYRSRVPRFS